MIQIDEKNLNLLIEMKTEISEMKKCLCNLEEEISSLKKDVSEIKKDSEVTKANIDAITEWLIYRSKVLSNASDIIKNAKMAMKKEQ